MQRRVTLRTCPPRPLRVGRVRLEMGEDGGKEREGDQEHQIHTHCIHHDLEELEMLEYEHVL